MATRRNVPSSMTKEDTASSQKSDISPAVPSHVIVKLLFFTFAMVVFPISSYYLTLNTIFGGNSTYSGGFAAVVANVVLIGYVIVAMKEDQTERLEKEGKKDR